MRYVSLALFGVVLTGLVSCADINGGGVAALEAPNGAWSEVTGQYPAVVKVLNLKSNGLCTGTFISDRAILTAAHCTLNPGEFAIQSSFGTFRTRQIETAGPGTVGDPTDIALLLFNQPIAKYGEGHILPLGDAVSSLEKVRIIGFGCDDFNARTGSGTKRTGTNQVYRISTHIEILTPLGRNLASAKPEEDPRGIIGPENRAGSCFGDSGGPMVREVEGRMEVVGVSHAAGSDKSMNVSLYSDLSRRENQEFLVAMNSRYSLNLFDASLFPQVLPESSPLEDTSWYVRLFSAIGGFFKAVIAWVTSLF